jgi:hypothetical protein
MRFSDFLLVSDPTDLNFIVGYTDDQNIRINVLDLFTGQIIGSGTPGYVPVFTGANVIDDSVIFQHGSNIVIGGVDSLGYKLAVSGSLYSSNGAVINSTVSGADALRVIGGDGDIFVIPNDLGQSISSLRRIIHPPAVLTTESATLGQVNTAISNLDAEIDILLALKVDKTSVGVANGVASLDAGGKVPLSQIPDSIIGQVEYMGTWNAFTNTPTLNPLVPEQKGHYYVVSAAGVFGGVDYAVGDWIISNGVEWQKVDNTDAVTSVFGRIGAILPLEADYQSFYPRLSQAYDNPTWINSLAFTKITGVPPFLLENQTITLSGDVTGSGKTSISSTISNNAVSNEKLRDSVGTSVIGRAANSTGDPADIQASTDGHVLLRSAGNLLFGLISSDSISSINWSKITGTPTTLSGYGITDAYTKTESDNKFVPYTGANANVNLGSNNITANSFIKSGGTSSQFLKADGSVDTSQYVPTTRSINAGTGLTGGGNLSSDVNISFDTTWGDTRYAYRTRQLTINGVTYDLSADRTWSVGTVTSISTNGPITGGIITGSGTIGITQSSASTDGYLSSTDWNTFNNKQPAGDYVTIATDQTITGLKTIVRSGDVLNFKIGTDTLYGLKVAYNQNELVPSGEATWSFVNTFNRDGSGYSVTPLSFFRGVLVTGERLISSSVNANLLDYYSNNPTGRYPVYAYNTGVQQFSESILVGYNTGLVNAVTGAIASLPSGVVANFNGRVIGSNAVNSNEFATLSQLTGGTVTSVGLIMPPAFTVSNSPVTSAGTLTVVGAGNATQYVRGDGALATLPTSGTGGGASVSYYLNGSVNQGTIGGVTYYEMNRTPIFGAGTDFTRNTNGYIASFLTDAGDPALLAIPAGNWNFETYFQASSGGGSPTFYLELYKYDGTTFTLIASNSGSPKLINDGTNIEAYFSALAVPQTTLTLTDRLAIRIYVTTSGRTITLHTENDHLCQVITTFTTGLTALNGLTSQVQYFATGTSGTDFNILSAVDTHTFNLPTASAVNRGALSSADWTTFNSKIGGTISAGQVAFGTAANTIGGSNNLFWDNVNGFLGVGTTSTIDEKLTVLGNIHVDGSGSGIGTFGPFVEIGRSNGPKIQATQEGSDNDIQGLAFFTKNSTITADNPTERWRITNTGILQSNGAQTIQTSTGNLTLATAAGDGNILLTPNGTGFVDVKTFIQIDNYAAGTTVPNTAGVLRILSGSKTGWAPNDELGKIEFFGTDTSGIGARNLASIRAVNSTGNGTTTTTSNGELAFYTSDANALETEKVRITSTGNLLVNTINEGIYVTRSSENTFGSHVRARKARGTVAAPTIVLNGDTVANLTFEPYNGTSFSEATGIRGVVNGTVSVGVTPTDLVFSAGSNGTVVVNERWRITSAGILQSNGAQTIQTSTGNLTIATAAGNGNIVLSPNGTGTVDISEPLNPILRLNNTTNTVPTSNNIGEIQFFTNDASVAGTGIKAFINAVGGAFGAAQGAAILSFGTADNNSVNAIERFRIWNTGNVVIQNGGTFTDAGFRLDVNGSTRFNGLSTIQGTTASDSGQLGAELLTTGTGDASWTGTSFATGYTHVAGSTTTLTSTLAGVVNTFYQITYTVTGRTAGSFTIAFGGESFAGLTATGAVGPRATTTGTLVITPTSDFNGTIVLSIRVISNSSASVTFNNSAGTTTSQIRISSVTNNTFIGLNSGRTNTTGPNNSFYGRDSGQNNTTGGSNSFFGTNSGQNNTTGSTNSFFGGGSGQNNTTGSSNSFFGVSSGLNHTTGSNNTFIGLSAGRFAGSGTTAMTSVDNSIYLGFQTRGLNATGSTNELVIGYNVVGLGSNTTVLGNTSTTHGRWYGSLLLGTTTNAASSILTMESTTQGFLPPRMTSAQRTAIASPATGLIVYQTDGVEGLYLRTSTAWRALGII